MHPGTGLNHSVFRFYQELNDFLPQQQRGQSRVYSYTGHPSVKDAIEAQGVPHTEVDLVIVDGAAGAGVSVDFDYQMVDGDRVAVYPVFESLDITGTSLLRPAPLRETRFVVDVHLGKLARLLRLMGFDTYYANDLTDAEIAMRSKVGHRIVLTRDQGLLKRSIIDHGYWVRSQNSEAQAVEVVRRFDLALNVHPFTRCPACNGTLVEVAADKVADAVPQRSRAAVSFAECDGCGKIYWPGSHRPRIVATIRRILGG
ncbi:MAG TPA: Mut7-C RNAse domain-containing protein [Spirochaetia bacterium]|nr:Mut7-C RNAse domain-containing protein [Spirochaetia bacterium]